MAVQHKSLGWLAIVLALGVATVVQAQPAGHITGVGGIFIQSKDPKALARWYRDVLGVPIEAWGGAILKYDAPGHPGEVVWNAFPNGAKYMAPSTREFMINFAVDDLDAFLARLKDKGVAILSQRSDATGAYAWVLDPDGTKIELRQPPKAK